MGAGLCVVGVASRWRRAYEEGGAIERGRFWGGGDRLIWGHLRLSGDLGDPAPPSQPLVLYQTAPPPTVAPPTQEAGPAVAPPTGSAPQ